MATKKATKKIATKKLTPMTKKPAAKKIAAKKASPSKGTKVAHSKEELIAKMAPKDSKPVVGKPIGVDEKKALVGKVTAPQGKGLIIPLAVKGQNGAYTVCKTEKCLSCHNLASATTDPTDDETTIICGFEVRQAGIVEDDDLDVCPMYVMQPNSPNVAAVLASANVGDEEEEEEEEEQLPEPDFVAVEKIEKYAFVGDSLARVEHPKANQKTYDLTVSFVEEYNMQIARLKAELEKNIVEQRQQLSNQLLAAKQSVMGDPDAAQGMGVAVLLGLASADGIVGDDDDQNLDSLDEFEDDEEEFAIEEEDEDDER